MRAETSFRAALVSDGQYVVADREVEGRWILVLHSAAGRVIAHTRGGPEATLSRGLSCFAGMAHSAARCAQITGTGGRRVVSFGVMEKRATPWSESTAVNMLADATREYYGNRLVSLALFGSVARKTATPESDVDVLVVADNLPRGRMSRVREFESIEAAVESAVHGPSVPISPVIKSREELLRGSPLLWDMTEEAILLYDKDDFLRTVLDRTREQLRCLGAHRVFRGNAWYWVLKESFVPGEVFQL